MWASLWDTMRIFPENKNMIYPNSVIITHTKTDQIKYPSIHAVRQIWIGIFKNPFNNIRAKSVVYFFHSKVDYLISTVYGAKEVTIIYADI